MSPATRFTAQTGGRVAVLTRHGDGRQVLVRISSVNAVAAGSGGQSEHKTTVHIGELHPLRVTEPFEQVLEILGWEKLAGPGGGHER